MLFYPKRSLRVTAWHVGTDSQTHIRHTAYVAFYLYEGGCGE